MLKPAINEVLEKIDNRYFLISTVAKRARDLVDGEEPLVYCEETEKPVCVATNEIVQGKIGYRLLSEEEVAAQELAHQEYQEKKLREQD